MAAVGTSLNQGSSVPSKAPTPLPATFDQKDYPDIRFWKKTDWTEFCSKKKDLTTRKTATKLNESMKPRGKTRISESDENINNQYLEKEDGSTIGGTEAGCKFFFLDLRLTESCFPDLRPSAPLVVRIFEATGLQTLGPLLVGQTRREVMQQL